MTDNLLTGHFMFCFQKIIAQGMSWNFMFCLDLRLHRSLSCSLVLYRRDAHPYYATTNDAEEEKKDNFYDQRQSVQERQRAKDIIVRMGDFNAKIGADRLWRHHGRTWTRANERKGGKVCKPVLPQPAGDRRQHLSPQTNPQGHMEISRSSNQSSNRPHLH